MNFQLALATCVLFSLSAVSHAEKPTINYEKFVKTYFSAWQNVQKPNANTQDLEQYLALLTDDIGYQHLPYSNDDSRQPDGKQGMRKGMSYYLGVHTDYEAKLTNYTFGHNVVVIEFKTSAKGIHPDNGQAIDYSNDVLEVLEIEDGKVSVIRHYNQ